MTTAPDAPTDMGLAAAASVEPPATPTLPAPPTTPPVFLWLDDIRSPPDASWTVARTAEEARRILLAGPVETASLDHDLGECEECVSSFPPRGYRAAATTCRHRMTGYDLLKWMGEADVWPKFKPAVHSANVVGRANMISFIERYWPDRGAAST